MQLLWIIVLPFAAALVTPLAGRMLKGRIGWFAVAVSAVCTGLVAMLGRRVVGGEVVGFSTEFPAAELGIRLTLFADGFGWMFALLVSGIGTLICIYAQHYLGDDEARVRFFAFLLLFEGAMLGVVLSANLIALVVFWELTSVASFLLIGFWHQQERARYGAYKALLITGIGGLALLSGVILIYLAYGTFELRELFALAAADKIQSHPLFTPILILVLIGAFTKSAQFPFHFWLPDAMTAPTPVSAYLHSATMVKAGVFLLGRLFPIFRGADEWFWIVSVTGMATMLLGAYAAVRKHDLKALLAYSTISQLGLITILFGIGSKEAVIGATFHILNHATFKAGLFLVVGIVDHETGTRDKRLLRGLAKAMPLTAIACGACALASAGVPLLNGFLSKEMFYEAVVSEAQRGRLEWLWPIFAVVGSVFTFVYSMEVFHGVFFGGLDEDRLNQLKTQPGTPLLPNSVHDPSWGMLAPVLLLAVVCVAVGLFPVVAEHWLVSPAVAGVWGERLEFHVALFHGLNLPLMMSVLTLAAGWVVYHQRHRLTTVQQRLALPFTANRVYDGMMSGLLAGTERLTNTLQSGRLRRYFWWMTAALLAGTGAAFALRSQPDFSNVRWSEMSWGEASLPLLMILAVFAVLALNSQRLAAVITLGAVGFLLAAIYLTMSAPDLALTQLLVEAVTIIIFMLVLWRLPQDSPRISSVRQRFADGVLATIFGGVVAALALGAMLSRSPQSVAQYFTDNSKALAGGRNVVNVILVDFRGFDTLGEITVLAIATLGAYALIKMKIRNPKSEIRGKSE
jgi:multicomponent K+:H+ antiporter subunit A